MMFKKELEKMGACPEAVEWVGEKTMLQAWKQCHRGDWMLWFFSKKFPKKKREITLAKGHCANTVRHLMKDERSRNAVDVAIRYGEGKATEGELENVSDAAASYAASYAASDAASYAAYASAASAAASDAYASYPASYAAAADDAAKEENQKKTAQICRKYLKIRNKKNLKGRKRTK